MVSERCLAVIAEQSRRSFKKCVCKGRKYKVQIFRKILNCVFVVVYSAEPCSKLQWHLSQLLESGKSGKFLNRTVSETNHSIEKKLLKIVLE